MKNYLNKPTKLFGLCAIAALVAGCQPDAKVDPRAGGGGLQGNWVSSDNIFTANFNNGSFIATANDTGSVISEGNYVAVSSKQVNLQWNGKVTGKPNSANCSRPDVLKLNCVDAAGRAFVLVKSNA